MPLTMHEPLSTKPDLFVVLVEKEVKWSGAFQQLFVFKNVFLLFTYVFSFFFTNFSIKIHSPKRSTDYGTSLSQVTSEVTSPSYHHFTKNSSHGTPRGKNPGIAAHTLSQNPCVFPFSASPWSPWSPKYRKPPGYKHKLIHINSINSQRIHSGTFHQFHSLKKNCLVFCFSTFSLLELSELRLSKLDPDMASGILAKRTRNVGYHSVSPGDTSKCQKKCGKCQRKISLFTICTQVPSRELLCIMVFFGFLTVLFIE